MTVVKSYGKMDKKLYKNIVILAGRNMRDRSMAKDKHPNEALRYHRLLRGWSQHKVADEIGASNEMISRWEGGQKKTSSFYQEKLCALFGRNAAELGFLSSPAKDPSRKASAQKTGETEPMTTVPTSPFPLFVTEPSHDLFNIESWERLSRIFKKNKPSSLNETTLDDLETILGRYWRLFYNNAIPIDFLSTTTVSLLQAVTSLLEYSYSTPLEQRLFALASKTSLLAGRIALDQHHYTAVDGYYTVSFQAAQKGEDAILSAVVLARIASSLIEKKQPEKAIPFFQESQKLCSPEAEPVTTVWLAVHEAEAWAMVHQEMQSLQALERAESHQSMIVSGKDPYWTGFDTALLSGFKGVCNLHLRKSEAAHQALQDAIALTTPAPNRQTAIFFSDRATAFLQQGDLNAACSMAEEALLLAVSAKSKLVMQRLLNVRNDMERWRQESCVQHLDEQLLTMRKF
jgi:transcriptional regulator with XRE-family HTH domain